MPSAGRLEVMFDYSIDISPKYEPDEYGEAVVELDGTYSIVRRLVGKAGVNQVSEVDKVVRFSYVDGPGWHTVTLGAHNNRKTAANEYTVVKYDKVKITLHEGDP